MWTHLFIRCIFGCYLYAWHCAKNCGGSPRKTQHGLLGFPNLIEMKQCSLQHSTELCYTLHRQCGSQSDTLGCENSRGQTLESSRREGHCKPVGCWSHPYTHYLTGGNPASSPCSPVLAVSQVAVFAATVGLLCFLPEVVTVLLPIPTYLIYCMSNVEWIWSAAVHEYNSMKNEQYKSPTSFKIYFPPSS